jgi:hypothetical protein
MSDEQTLPRFADCALPKRCECARRKLADDVTCCAIPSINALAEQLGWQRPYPRPKLPSFRGRPMWYRLIGRLPVPCDDYDEWTEAFEHGDRHVRSTHIGGGRLWVSTVFLGMNHAILSEEPILFECLLFDEEMHSHEGLRCSTWEQAEMIHQAMVDAALNLVRKADADMEKGLHMLPPKLEPEAAPAPTPEAGT